MSFRPMYPDGEDVQCNNCGAVLTGDKVKEHRCQAKVSEERKCSNCREYVDCNERSVEACGEWMPNRVTVLNAQLAEANNTIQSLTAQLKDAREREGHYLDHVHTLTAQLSKCMKALRVYGNWRNWHHPYGAESAWAFEIDSKPPTCPQAIAVEAISLTPDSALAKYRALEKVAESAKELQEAEEALTAYADEHGGRIPELGTDDEDITLRVCDAAQVLSDALRELEEEQS